MDEDMKRLLETLQKPNKKYDIEKIQRAYDYARRVHEGQRRDSGEDFIHHPIAVAEIVAELELDTDSICAALLHDTVEDGGEKTNLKEIAQLFGEDVAMLVDGLTKIVTLQIEDKEEAHIENIRKMLLAMNKDIRVIFIKLCDRLHNMRTLSAKTEKSQRVIALETMYIYAPLAHRLGMQRMKQELENLGLLRLDPIGYKEVTDQIEAHYGASANMIENARAKISARLQEAGVHFDLQGRKKSVYSVYRKMYNQNRTFNEIYDFYAIRVIVDTELECYAALGLIHEMFSSVPGRFKDYISTPKPNQYRSLHTTVMMRDAIPLEVQIRTYEMHQVAEYGLAAHWKYKSGEKSKEEIDEKLQWIAKLLESDENTRDPDEFMRSFKTDIFNDETFVFTPKGDVISLPLGSTVIDFAYAIHSAVGNRMIGGKINGKIVPINRVLQNGEIVEIITSNASRGPSRDWLKIVQTAEARNKIRQWFKKEKKSENIQVGRKELERELRHINSGLTEAEKNEIIDAVAKKIGYTEMEDLYNTIGYGGLSVSRLTRKLQDEYLRLVPPKESEREAEEEIDQQIKLSERPKNLKHGGGIMVEGESGYQVKFAKCCNPLPGDEVTGFVTRGFGISIHKTDCPNVAAGLANPDNQHRWVRARWETDFTQDSSSKNLYEAILQIHLRDEIGALAEITAMLAEMKVSILSIGSKPVASGGLVMLSLTIGCRSVSHYHSIVSKLKSIDAIESISRGFLS
ncbi:MAG: bifunctional (p)ppGpp synthetase/guanosine-3',5'-bis(diphosphate) 3'-pyrophosphohydrolase [Eubacteriales bacterium]